MESIMKSILHHLFIVLALFAGLDQAAAQGTTAINYQGQLQDGGTNASGAYTMIFSLYDSASGGTQIGGTVTTSATLANGLFSVNLDFGAGAFNGSARWLDITITNGGTTQELSPRVQVLPAPYAIFANTASNLVGTVSGNQLSGTYSNKVNFSNGLQNNFNGAFNGYFTGVFTGDGIDITNVDAEMFDGLTSSNYVLVDDLTNFVTFDDLTNLPSGSVPDMEVFDTNGTFIVPEGVAKITVEVWGGGGGGQSASNSPNFVGSGGGGGGYGKEIFDVTPGDNYEVTVGLGGASDSPGGPSSFGSTNGTQPLISATGGFPGTNIQKFFYTTNGGPLVKISTLNSIGGGGGKSDALINITGGSGGYFGSEFVISANQLFGGSGGNAGCGGSGGRGDLRVNTIDSGIGAESGQVPGGGGGGGAGFEIIPENLNATDVFDPGGAGGHGRVIVFY
jgi:hypothetical protein